MRAVCCLVCSILPGCARELKESSLPQASPELPSIETHTESGGQSGEDPGYGSCEGTTLLGQPGDELTGADGPFSAATAVKLADGSQQALLTWSDGTETVLWAELRWDGPIRLINGAYSSGYSGTYCEPRIEIDGSYTLQTGDGLLDESGAATLVALRASVAGLQVEWDSTSLQGEIALPKGSLLQLSAHFDGGMSGVLRLDDEVVATFLSRF